MKEKEFDCVKMKRQAQEKLREEFNDATDEEERRRTLKKLEESEDIVARKWREIRKQQDLRLRQAG